MSKKTVRWSQLLKKQCPNCLDFGIIQQYDWEFGEVHYVVCECKLSKKEKEERAKDANGPKLL